MTAAAALAGSRGRLLFERNLMVYRRAWMIIFSGVFEPLFYLFSMGIGLGHFVGKVPLPDGELVSYSSFVAPALLASAAMNGAIFDASNVFWKMKYAKVYDAVLSTPVGPADVAVGETAWALFRGALYALAFMCVAGALGLIESAWGLLLFPGAVLIGFAFAGMGVAATTYMRTLAGLRADRARAAAAVPVLGDVLPDLDVSRLDPVDRPLLTAVPRRLSCCARSTSAPSGGRRPSTSPTSSRSGSSGS